MLTATHTMRLLVNGHFATEAEMVQQPAKEGWSPAYTHPVVKSDLLTSSSETYGRKSFLYFRCRDAVTTRALVDLLRKHGGKPNFSWCPDNPNSFNLRVHGFKGWHHWQ